MRRATSKERTLLRRALHRWRGYRIPNGIPKKHAARPRDFDPDQLAIGIGVELEHTSRPEIAMEIAMAHLTERSDYYKLLEKMEKAPQAHRKKRSSRSKRA
jgi:hypothetical protein